MASKKMAKKGSRSRVRVFLAEFEGDDETIQEGLQAISVAAGKMFDSKPSVVKVISDIPEGISIGSQEEAVDVTSLEASLENDVVDVESIPRRRSKKKSKPLSLTMVTDLDLRPAGKPSCRDFFSQKAPKNHQQAVAVAVYYLQRIVELGEVITANHIYTCFKDINRRIPNNLVQVIRDTSRRKSWIFNAEDGGIQISNIGENFVEHDLSAST